VRTLSVSHLFPHRSVSAQHGGIATFVRDYLCLFVVLAILLTQMQAANAEPLDASLNEQRVMMPVTVGGVHYELETTIFKPAGAGPFPLLLMNHGKSIGDPHKQDRDRFLSLAAEFVERGYAVVVPMRRGFAKSDGDYYEYECNMEANGQLQADDVQAAIEYLQAQPWVDKDHVVVAGQSYGGLAALAFGTRTVPGVRGVINFAGGLRLFNSDCRWQSSLIDAFRDYGSQARVPSLWFYGENDHFFSSALVQRLHSAYVASGSHAKLIAYGRYRNDAHGMVASWGSVSIWWPETEKFLRAIGMPVGKKRMLVKVSMPHSSHYARLDNAEALPYLDQKGREAYREFLKQPLPRAFAMSASGAWSWAEDGDDPKSRVLADCEKRSGSPCELYAVDDSVVWQGEQTQLAASSKPDAS
jgi:dienelactone hydrolase